MKTDSGYQFQKRKRAALIIFWREVKPRYFTQLTGQFIPDDLKWFFQGEDLTTGEYIFRYASDEEILELICTGLKCDLDFSSGYTEKDVNAILEMMRLWAFEGPPEGEKRPQGNPNAKASIESGDRLSTSLKETGNVVSVHTERI